MRTQQIGKIAAGLAALLAMNLPAYAQEPTYDAGIQGALDAEMVTVVEESQTFDDKTLTLHWVYADVNRFALSYTISGLENPPEGDMTSPFWSPEVTLSDAQSGAVFSFAQSWGLPDETTGDIQFYNGFYSQAMRPNVPANTSAIDNDYFLNEYGGVPETLTLQVSITLNLQPPSFAEPPVETVGPYEFTVEVLMMAPLELQPALIVASNGVTARLESLTLASSETQARLCYNLPDQQDWQPNTTLIIGEQTAEIGGWGMTERPDPADTERCFDLSYVVFYDQQPTTLILTLNKIQTSEPTESPEFWEQVKAAMLAQGIEINYTLDNAVIREIVSKPAGMTEEEVYQIEMAVRNDLRPGLTGPWVFEVEIPGTGE